jgi:hypothetical protein
MFFMRHAVRLRPQPRFKELVLSFENVMRKESTPFYIYQQNFNTGLMQLHFSVSSRDEWIAQHLRRARGKIKTLSDSERFFFLASLAFCFASWIQLKIIILFPSTNFLVSLVSIKISENKVASCRLGPMCFEFEFDCWWQKELIYI